MRFFERDINHTRMRKEIPKLREDKLQERRINLIDFSSLAKLSLAQAQAIIQNTHT